MGPSGYVETDIETPMPHRTKLCFTPPVPGEYSFRFSWNRAVLPNAPTQAIASAAMVMDDGASYTTNKSRASSISSAGSGGDHKVVLTGKGLAKAVCGIEAEFTIDGSRAGPG